MKIAIAAASGNVGSRIVQVLNQKDVELVLLGRNVEKLKKLGAPQSGITATDIGRPEQVIAATKNVDALFWMVPPLMSVPSLKQWYQQVTKAGIAAVKENKIKKVVLLSSLGAGPAKNQGVISFCGEMEYEFFKLDCDILALRPGYFLENITSMNESIVEKGVISAYYPPDHDIPFISTDDIGDVAAQYLADLTWHGHWQRNLMGPENITFTQVCERIGNILGKEISYEHVSIEKMLDLFAKYGACDTVQKELRDLGIAIGDPDGVYACPRTYESFTSTTLETVIRKKLLS